VVATGEGSIGNSAIFEGGEPAIASAENCVVRCETKTNAYYLAAFLLTKYGRIQLEAHALGPSGQSHLYPWQIKRLQVAKPGGHSEVADQFRKTIEMKKRANQTRAKLRAIFSKYIPPRSLAIEQISSAMPLPLCLSEERLDPRFWSAKIAALNKMFLANRDIFQAVREIVSEPVHRGRQPPYDALGETVPVLKTTDVQNSRIDWERCRTSAKQSLMNFLGLN